VMPVKLRVVLLAAFAGLAMQAFGSAAYAQVESSPAGPSGSSLAIQIEELERSWTMQSGAGQYRYFAEAISIASVLSAKERGEAEVGALQLLSNLLSKRATSVEVGAADLVAQSRVARFVLAHLANTPELRRVQAQSLAELLKRVRRELQADYVPKQVYMNVAPPAGQGPRIAGMSPDAIADPSAREKYEEAILQNQLDNLTNTRQAELQRMNEELGKEILGQLRQRAAAGELNVELIEALLRAPGFSAEEKESLTQAVHDARRVAGR